MRIQKHIALFLAVFLLVSNSGLALNVHYCGDNIASITSGFAKEEVCELPILKEKECCASKAESHKKCCSDKEINLENDTDTIVIKSFSFDLATMFIISEWKPLLFNEVTIISHSQDFDYCCDANAPPLYQLYSQYILYA